MEKLMNSVRGNEKPSAKKSSINDLLHRKRSFRSVFNNQGSCVDVKSSANYKEAGLFKEIKDIENKLKDLPYLDLKVESKDIEDIINKAIQDLVANIEEHHELNEMINQINNENKETDEKIASVKRAKKSVRRKDAPPSLLSKSPSDEMLKSLALKKSSKMIVQKKLTDLKIKNDDQKTMISTFIGNLCKQGKRSELEEKVIKFKGKLKVKKMELQLLRLTEEKANLEEKLKRQSSDTKVERNSSQILTENNKRQYDVSRGKENMPNNAQSGARDTSVKSAKMKEKELDDGKNSDMSRKGSFMTNVSRRYQECDDENEEECLEKLSSKSSCENLSQTYSRNKKELILEKRNTQDIKSLERFGQPNSTKSTKELEKKNNRYFGANSSKKKYFSNTTELNFNYPKKTRGDFHMTQVPKMDSSLEHEKTSNVLYKNFFALP